MKTDRGEIAMPLDSSDQKCTPRWEAEHPG